MLKRTTIAITLAGNRGPTRDGRRAAFGRVTRINLAAAPECRHNVCSGEVTRPAFARKRTGKSVCNLSQGVAMLQIHVILSLVGILSGLIVLYRLLLGETRLWTALFLITTILTSLSGFPLPPFGFDPPRAVGVLSLILLLAAVIAYYAFQLAGIWRLIYAGCAVAALYLNVFVLVAQGFQGSVPVRSAPTGSEPPFAIAQGVVPLVFIVLGVLAARRFRPGIEARA